MPGEVKREQPTHGPHGQARTRLARRAVITAARTLFLERGYASTTVDAISDRSEVPPATVYRLFTSKLGILKALLDTSIAGDDRPLALPDRPDVAALFTEADPIEVLEGLAGITTAINQRSNEVYQVVLSAAGSDPAAAELLADIRRQRDQGQRHIVRGLARSGSLRPGLTEREAADLVHALMSPEVYRLLVVDRRWTPTQYERWLTTTLTQQLT